MYKEKFKRNMISSSEAYDLDIKTIHDLYKKHVNKSKTDLLSSFTFGNEMITHSEGQYIYTKSGKNVLDFTGGIGVLNHGHNHPRILKARAEFAKRKKMEVHKSFFSPFIAALSSNISNLLPKELNYCFFPNSGSEAIEWAVKTAIKNHNGERTRVLHSNLSFHGKLFFSEAITASPENSYKYPKFFPTCNFLFNDFSSVQDAINKSILENGFCDIAAIIVEPYNISNLLETSSEFLRSVQEIAKKYGIVVIYDEVYSGWCKTGNIFNFLRDPEICPDILCSAKSLGGGKASIACVVIKEKLFKLTFDKPNSSNLMSTTFNGFGEETVTALEAVNIIVDENYTERSFEIEEQMRFILKNIESKYNFVKTTRGRGAIHGIFFDTRFTDFEKITKFIPIEMMEDERFGQKLLLASIVENLYDKHNILSVFSFGHELHLILSPPICVNNENIKALDIALHNTFDLGPVNLMWKFVKKRLLTK